MPESVKNVVMPATASQVKKRPVLILGWIPRIALTVARSLNRHGVEVDLADCVQAATLKSRAIRNFYRLPHPKDSSAGFLRQLKDVLSRGCHDLLIPTDDVALCAVMEHYEQISALVRLACPPPEVTNQVLNKELTLEAARQCEIRVPRTATVFNSAGLRDLEQEIPLPWILKPAAKEKDSEDFTSVRVDSLQDVIRRYPEPRRFEPPMLVQEYCEGVGVGVQMLLYEGQPLATCQHRRLKELPYGGGVAVTAVAERPDAHFVGWTLKLLRKLRWQGIAMVEFRMNPATGEAVFMEVNGRYWGTIGLPVSAGLHLPYYDWQILHGEQPEIPRLDLTGVRWRWTPGYFYRLYLLAVKSRRSADARAELKKTLHQLTSDFSPSVRDALFDSSDPVPAILDLANIGFFIAKHAPKQVFDAIRKRIPSLGHSPPTSRSTHF